MKEEATPQPVAFDSPGVNLAYELVRPSYDWAVQRLDASDSRLQHLLTLGVALLAVGAAIKPDVSSSSESVRLSFSFFISLAAFITLMIWGLIAHHRGKIKLITPRRLYNDWRDASEVEFKNEMLRYAADDYDSNQDSLRMKRIAETVLGFLIGAETLGLVFWIAGF